MSTPTTITRRAALTGSAAGAAAIVAGTAPAIAVQTPDPIFAAIEAHKAACARLDRAIDAYCHAEEHGSEAAITAADVERDLAADAMDALAMDFLQKPPVTAAGAVAFLAYIAELDVWAWPEDIERDVYRMLAGALGGTAGGAS